MKANVLETEVDLTERRRRRKDERDVIDCGEEKVTKWESSYEESQNTM